MVLGALLLAVLILFLSCSGGDDEDGGTPRGGGPATSTPNPGAGPLGSGTPVDEPSFEESRPPGGKPALPAPSDAVVDPEGDGTDGQVPGAPGAPGPGTSGNPDLNVAAAAGQCADAEVSVTPIPSRTAAKRGTPVEILLKIKNVSTRTCSRDVGADLQEIYIKQGAFKVWSSDTCSTVKNSNVQKLASGAELEFGVTWNGRQSSRCSAGLAVGPAPQAGEYEVFGRLGGKVSAPVRLTLSA